MSGNGQAIHTEHTPTRWRPSRSGLINFYRYDQQEFHFHQGRLLLRGNNGTGKSRVLALQLPFLLDGEISPDRVEPDCDRAKRFEWNLLMNRFDDRVGYTWIEFERTGDDGVRRHLTLGCGVRAAAGRGVVSKWFFVTPLRVGQGLMLCSSQNSPLGKDALAEAIGSHGRVILTAREYREEVNRCLFGLSQPRYEALVRLLIELRQPKLSRHLDEQVLSDAMSDALTPVSQDIIQQVADAMRTMDQDRTALTNLQSAQASTDAFLVEYRRYAQIVALHRSRDVRESHSEYERCLRRLREAEAEHVSAITEADRLREEMTRLSVEKAGAEERRRTLESSPEMRSARELDDARRQAEDRKADAGRAGLQLDGSMRICDGHEAEYKEGIDHLGEATNRLDGLAVEVHQLANTCAMEQPHTSTLAKARFPRPDDLDAIAATGKRLEQACQDRQKSIRHLRDLNQEVAAASHSLHQAIQQRDVQSTRVTELSASCQQSQQAIADAVEALRLSYRDWHASLVHLKAIDPAELTEAIGEWAESDAVADSPARLAAEQALTRVRQGIATDRAKAVSERDQHQCTAADLVAERHRLREGQHRPPPVPYTRVADARNGRAGAALWQLCEFADAVPSADRAGLEAAMESAGILDAWVFPDGHLDRDVLDTILLPHGQPVSGPNLIEAVRPAWPGPEPSPVPLEIVAGILERIALGPASAPTWVDADGSWQVGVLSGRWHKSAAEHIGQAAREAARLRRLDQLDREIAAEQRAIDELGRVLAALDDRLQSADAEARRVPSDAGVRSALADRDALQRQLAQERSRLQDTEEALTRTKATLQQATARRDAAATDLGLLSWIDRLQELEDALADYRRALSGLWSAAERFVRSGQSAAAAQRRLEAEQRRVEQLAAASQQASERASAAESRFRTLQETTGAAAREVQQRLQDVIDHLRHLEEQQGKAREALGANKEKIEQSAKSVAELQTQIEGETRRRDHAIRRLLHLAASSLIDLTHESLVGAGRGDLAVTTAVELARRIYGTLGEIDADDKAWAGTQRSIHNHIQNLTNALLSYNYRPEITTEDETIVVTVQDQAARLSMREFSAKVADDIVQRRTLLTQRELELLENYLIHDVAVELGKLTREGEELVVRMNRELDRRPNSTGLRLRFNWQPDPDGPVRFAEARRKLLGDHVTWSPDDRATLGQFLQEQITRTREADITGTWQEQLATALDYRRWHTFHVERRQDNGKWVRLTRKTHGTGSGGEKAVALTIPQFAAAAAYYDTAARSAPRLILLDEAFVGIDRDMRGKCMGLLHEFDLDFVMTSEIEWGCYPTIPGLAIYQLSAREGIDAVWASRWVWNGRERVHDPPAETSSTGLFGAHGEGQPA